MVLQGRVVEVLANVRFRVELENGKTILCYLAGKMKQNHINVILYDKVTVELPEQSEIGRITFRSK